MATHQLESLDAKSNTATLALDSGLYPIDVIYGAAYALIDRAYVLLDREPNTKGKGHRFVIHLRGKMELGDVGLQALSGEFGNELLSQALRRKVVKQNNSIIEEIVTQAIAGLRETFEELGILLAHDAQGRPVSAAELATLDRVLAANTARRIYTRPSNIPTIVYSMQPVVWFGVDWLV